MKLVALSGGIAAGKSTIARRFAELGAVHIDADQLAREVVAPGTEGLAEVKHQFGDEVISADGSLDRQRLAEIVFGHPERLAVLNGIVHPRVQQLFSEKLRDIEQQHPDAVVIYDVPLLVEAGQSPKKPNWDAVVIAEAPADVRINRMVELRGMTREEAERRIANQTSDEERRKIADVVIDTGGDVAHTLEQVDRVWYGLLGQR